MSTPPRRALIAALFFVVGALAVAPYTLEYHAGMNDEGIVLTAAARVLRGEVPYRDFDMFYSPGSMLISAAWMGVSGTSILAARMLMLVCAGVLTALIFLLSDQLLPRPSALAPPLLFALCGYSEWPVVSYHWMAITALMGCVASFAAWQHGGAPRWMWLCGVSSGLAGACLQTEGLASFGTVVLALALTRPFPKAAMLRFVGGVAVVWIPLVVAMAALGAAGPMAADLLVRAVSGLHRYRSQPYDPSVLIHAWAQIGAQWPSSWDLGRLAWASTAVSVALIWTLKYGLLFPVLLLALPLAWRRGGAWRCMAILWVLWTITKVDRFDMLYANYLTPAWYIALVLLLDGAWRRWGRPVAALAGFTGVVFILSGVSSFRDAAAYVHPIDTAAGRVYARTAEEAAFRQAVYTAAGQVSPPGSEAFAWPYASSFYFLTATRNPTRLDFLLPGQHTREQVVEAALALRRRGTPLLYYFPLSSQIFEEYRAYEPAWFESEMRWMNATLTEGYGVAGRVGPVEVYQRR